MLRLARWSLGRAGCRLGVLAAALAVSTCTWPSCGTTEPVRDYLPDRIDPKEDCPHWTYALVPPGQCPPVECLCIEDVTRLGVLEVLEQPRKAGQPAGEQAAPRQIIRTNVIWVKLKPGTTRQDMQEIADRFGAIVVAQFPTLRSYTLILPTADLKAVADILEKMRRDPRVSWALKTGPAEPAATRGRARSSGPNLKEAIRGSPL